MPTLEELLNDTDSGSYQPVSGYVVNDKYEDNKFIDIIDRTIGAINNQKSTKGESQSQLLTFRLQRKIDGYDITQEGTNIAVHYEIPADTVLADDNAPINVKTNDDYVLFSWLIPAKATQMDVPIEFMIYAINTADNFLYKTLPYSYKIDDTLEIGGNIPEPETSWYQDFVTQMQGYVSQAAESAAASETSAQNAAASEQAAFEHLNSTANVLPEIEAAKTGAITLIEQRANDYADKRDIKNVCLTGNAEGSFITVEDSANWLLSDMTLYGKSVQDGTPTPDAPLEIQSVENPMVTVCGKNLFDNRDVTIYKAYLITDNGGEWAYSNDSSSIRVPCEPNITYTVSCSSSPPIFRVASISSDLLPTSSNTVPLTGQKRQGNVNSVTYKTGANDKYLIVQFSTSMADTCINECQIEIGDTATSYLPYQAKTATLSDIVLRATPYGTRDRIFKDSDGLWKIERNIEELILDGVTFGKKLISWGSSYMPNANGLYCFYVTLPVIRTFNALCSHFKAMNGGISDDSTKESYFIGQNGTDTTWSMCFKDVDGVTSEETANQWLANEYANGNPVTIYYPKDTPTYETLPDSIQAELNALVSYANITNVFTDSELQPDMEIEYIKDINKIIADLQSQITV